MLLLLNIFEDGQHGHPLSVGHLPPWVAILSLSPRRDAADFEVSSAAMIFEFRCPVARMGR
jgi:hypothetical protein